jgi:predicted HTH domain antitoxin
MSTVPVSVDLPPGMSENEAKLFLAMKLFELHKVTLGQAAKLAGLSKRAFIEMLGQYEIPVFNYPAEELEGEIDW